MMDLSLPEPMKAWVEAQTASGRYSSVGDYVRDLIRRDQERQGTLTEVQALIDAGLASGVSKRTMADLLREARSRTLERS